MILPYMPTTTVVHTDVLTVPTVAKELVELFEVPTIGTTISTSVGAPTHSPAAAAPNPSPAAAAPQGQGEGERE